MAQIGLSLISVFLALVSTVPRTIERAFLGNDAAVLAELFSRDTPVFVSLPEPIAFSDIVTREQAYWVFERIFRSYPTIEFYPQTDRRPVFFRGGFIVKARWSFLDAATGNQHPLQVFLYLRPDRGSRPLWTIAEIKAEKI